MHRIRSASLVIASALLVACGSNAGGAHPDAKNGQVADAPPGPDAPPGTPDAAPGTPDAAPGTPDAMPPAGVAAIPLTSPDGTFYTAQVQVGSQTFAMVVDTGSTTAAVAGSSCSACAVSPKYTPGSSATDQHKTAMAQYGSGSWNGEIYKDNIGLGAGTPPVSVLLSSITSQQTFFDNNNNAFQGLLGLGGDGLLVSGTTSYLDQLPAKGVADVQAFQLCDSAGGTMWLGGYDPAATASAVQYTAMSSQYPYYAVTLSDLKLGTTSVGYTSSTAIADTGTTLFYLPKAVVSGVVAKANAATSVFSGQFTMQGGVYCAMAKSGVGAAQIDAAMQPLTMTFPGTGGSFTISAPATRSYMLDAGGGMWCIGIADNSSLFGLTLMGDMGLRGFVTVFDRVNKKVGFAPQKGCPAPANFTASTPNPLRERGHLPAL